MTKKNIDNLKRRNRVLFDYDSIVDPVLSYYKNIAAKNKDFKYTMQDLEFFRLYDNSFFKDYKEDGESIPHFTSMLTLYKESLIYGEGLIKPSVLCKNEKESQIINEVIPEARILISDRKKVDINKFSRLVIGDIKDLFKFNTPIGMDIMIMNYSSNYDEQGDIPNKSVAIIYETNTFTIANAYPEIKQPEG